MTAPVRCALYARVSTDLQAEKYGVASQLTELRALAKKRGYMVVEEFVDEGVSGATIDRPRLAALRVLVRHRGLDVVMAHTSDRISRALVDYLLVVEEVRRHGARVEFVSHTVDDTAEGVLREQVLGAVAEFERAKIRERTTRGAKEKARKGLKPTGEPPFGYRRDESALGGLAINEVEAAAVRRVFTWAADGVAIRAIATRLDTQGPPPRRGGRWSRTSVRTLLHADVYLGRGVYNRRDETGADGVTIREEAEWIRYRVTPLVSPALADRARAQLRRNVSLLGGRPARHVYLLGGLAVCGLCGRRMHGDSRNPTVVYRCDGRHLPKAEGRCRYTMPADRLDAPVWAALDAVLRDPDVLTSTAKASKLGIDARRVDAATELAELTRAFTAATTGRARRVDAFIAGLVDKAEFDARGPGLKAEAERLERAVAEAKARLDAGQAEADRHAALVRYCRLISRGLDRLDAAGRQALMRRIVTRAVVHPDRVDVDGAFQLTVAPEAPDPEGGGNCGGKLRHAPPSGAQYSLRLTVLIQERT